MRNDRLRYLNLASLALLVGLVVLSRDWSARGEEQSPPASSADAPAPENPNPSDPAQTLRQWREIDERLLALGRDLIDLEKRKRGLDEDLRQAREKFAPDDIGPASVFARRGLSRLSAQMDQSLREERRVREEIINHATRAHGLRDQFRPHLEALRADLESRNQPTPEEKVDLDRARLWLDGMSGNPAPQAMIRKIYGARLLSEWRRGEPPRAKGPRPAKPRNSPPAAPEPPLGDASEEHGPPPHENPNFDGARLGPERLEKRIDALETEVRALRKEVESLRKTLRAREQKSK